MRELVDVETSSGRGSETHVREMYRVLGDEDGDQNITQDNVVQDAQTSCRRDCLARGQMRARTEHPAPSKRRDIALKKAGAMPDAA